MCGSKGQSVLYFHKVARVLYGKKRGDEEYVVNLLLFLFHSKLQKVKVAFFLNSIKIFLTVLNYYNHTCSYRSLIDYDECLLYNYSMYQKINELDLV